MIVCASCRTMNPDGRSVCLSCGSELRRGGRGTATVAESAPGGSFCPQGHPIDPAWSRCPYCEPMGSAARGAPLLPTVLEGSAAEASRAGRTTRLEVASEEPVRERSRRTRLAGVGEIDAHAAAPQAASGPGTANALQDRRPVPAAAAGATGQQQPAATTSARLVAVLAAPSLRPEGAVFAIREGKNLLGAAAESDVCLKDDPQVSSEHALLLCRGRAFHLADRMSTNGTWVNGEELVGTHSVSLADRDRIRCGGTDLVFMVLDSDAAGRPSADGTDRPSPDHDA